MHTRTHNYSTRNRDSHLTPFHRLRSTNQSVVLNMIRVWNEIPDTIKQCTSYNSFKKININMITIILTLDTPPPTYSKYTTSFVTVKLEHI